jgi:hypothetical protein
MTWPPSITKVGDYIPTGGLVGRFDFAVSGFGGPWVVNSGGAPMACGDILETVILRPANPKAVLYQSLAMTSWGPEVAPGLYAGFVSTYNWPVCVFQDGNRLAVDGTLGYPIHVEGLVDIPPAGAIFLPP